MEDGKSLDNLTKSSLPNSTSNPVPVPGTFPDYQDFKTFQGKLYTECAQPGLFSLGYDDGVSTAFDEELLEILASEGVPATFYVNGYNWNDITQPEAATILRKIQAGGHQIACESLWVHVSTYL
jgi:peptidoglycan/xylan/chitin deacetylase (PgdA/CDA1 family)